MTSAARVAASALRIAVIALALIVGAAPAFAGQALSTREVQRLLAEAQSDLDSARALLARGEQRGARTRLGEAEVAYRKILDASPEEKDAAVGLSSVLFLTRRYEDGIRLMAPLYEAHKADHDIAHQLGLHLYRAGHQDSALPLLEEVAKDPGRFDASWLLAVHFYHQAAWERGLPFAERYVAERPDDARALGVLGTYYLKTERYADAVTALDRYIAVAPDNLAARINRANALFRLGQFDRAASEYETLVAAHPDRSRLLYNLAAVRIRQGRCQDALPLLDRFIAKEDKDGSARYFRADCLLRLGRLDDAKGAFEDARAGAENNPWIYHGLSRIALAAGRLEEAVTQATKAAELAPTDVDIVAWLGTVLRKAGHPDQAVGWHDKAIALASDRAPLHVERGRDLWLLNQLDEALDAFTRARTLDATLGAAADGIATVQTARGGSARTAGDLDGAEADLRAAVAIAPGYAPARVNLALLLVQGERVDEAAQLLAATPETDPGPDHAAVLALVRLRLGDTAGATTALQQATAGKTKLTPVTNEVNGYVAAQHGDWEGAARALDAAYDAAPRDELDRARVRAWFEVGLDKLGRGDAPAARAAMNRVAHGKAALGTDDRATLDFANAALTVLSSDEPEKATRNLQQLIRSPALRAARFAGVRETGQLYAAFGFLRANAPEKALQALGTVRGDAAPAAQAMARYARDLMARRAYAKKDFAGAARAWRELADADPDDGASRSNLAAALYAGGQRDEAERTWVALIAAGGPPEANYDLGVAADRRGDYKAAWQHFQTYLKGNPPEADAARERVRAKERVFGFGAGGGGT